MKKKNIWERGRALWQGNGLLLAGSMVQFSWEMQRRSPVWGGPTSSLWLGWKLSLQTLEPAAVGWKGGDLAGVAFGLQLWAQQATSSLQKALPGTSGDWGVHVDIQDVAQFPQFCERTNSSAFVQQEGRQLVWNNS